MFSRWADGLICTAITLLYNGLLKCTDQSWPILTGRLLREMLLGCVTTYSAIIGTQHRQIHLPINWHITNARSYAQASAININELAAMTIKLHVGGAGLLTSCTVCCCIWPHFKALMITKTVLCKIRMAHQAWQDTIIFLANQISHCHKISCTY